MTVRKLSSCGLAALLSSLLLGAIALSQPAVAVESPTAPEVKEVQAYIVTATEAYLLAAINRHGQATTYVFEVATKASGETLEGTIVKGSREAGSNNEESYYALGATGAVLSPGHTYYFRVVVEGESGTTILGPVVEFATPPLPHTEAVTGISATEATFHGTLTPLNSTTASEYSFNYRVGTECTGGDSSDGGSTELGNAGVGSGSVEVSTLGDGSSAERLLFGLHGRPERVRLADGRRASRALQNGRRTADDRR